MLIGVKGKHFKKITYATLVTAMLPFLQLIPGQERIENFPQIQFIGLTEAYGEEVMKFRLEVPTELELFGVFLRVVDSNGSRSIVTQEGLPSVAVSTNGVAEFSILNPSDDPTWRLELDVCPVATGADGALERAKNAWRIQSLSGAWELVPIGETKVVGVDVDRS